MSSTTPYIHTTLSFLHWLCHAHIRSGPPPPCGVRTSIIFFEVRKQQVQYHTWVRTNPVWAVPFQRQGYQVGMNCVPFQRSKRTTGSRRTRTNWFEGACFSGPVLLYFTEKTQIATPSPQRVLQQQEEYKTCSCAFFCSSCARVLGSSTFSRPFRLTLDVYTISTTAVVDPTVNQAMHINKYAAGCRAVAVLLLFQIYILYIYICMVY